MLHNENKLLVKTIESLHNDIKRQSLYLEERKRKIQQQQDLMNDMHVRFKYNLRF